MLWRVNPLQQPLHIQGRTMSQQKERQLQRSWCAPLERDTFETCPAPIPNSFISNTQWKRWCRPRFKEIPKEIKQQYQGIRQSSSDTWWHEGRATPNTTSNIQSELASSILSCKPSLPWLPWLQLCRVALGCERSSHRFSCGLCDALEIVQACLFILQFRTDVEALGVLKAQHTAQKAWRQRRTKYYILHHTAILIAQSVLHE